MQDDHFGHLGHILAFSYAYVRISKMKLELGHLCYSVTFSYIILTVFICH